MAKQAAQVKNLGQIAGIIISSEPPKIKTVLWYDEKVTSGCPIFFFDKGLNKWVSVK